MLCRIIFYLLLGVVLCPFFAFGQKVHDSKLNLTVVPGVSTIGLDPANNYSFFTFNLLTGNQRGTYILELSGLSSSIVEKVQGFQISGLTNLVGINYYRGLTPRERIKAENSGEVAVLKGIQISGLMNYVRGYSTGAQLSLGLNISKETMTGVQIGSLLNYSSKLMSGVQLGALSNLSVGSTLGVQVALYNRTHREMSGLQLGAINLSKKIQGKRANEAYYETGVQIGLINYCRTMNGYQLGLINLSGKNQGTQIGLINIYKPASKKGELNGTPVGLLNLDGVGSLEAFADETFLMNFSLSTGLIQNSGMLPANKVIYVMNQVMFRQSHFLKHEYRAYGWNWQKQYYSYSPDIRNELYYVSVGGGVSYVDFSGIDSKTNLLTEIGLSFGSRIFLKNRSYYPYVTVDANYFYSNNGQTLGPEKLMLSFGSPDDGGRRHELWPGFIIGLKIKP